jgi:hypothetical protein
VRMEMGMMSTMAQEFQENNQAQGQVKEWL